MFKRKKTISVFCGFIFVLLLSLFYLVKFKGCLLTEFLYHKGYFQLLNLLTGAKDINTLDFYTGEMENVVLGPLQSILSGLLFLTFCLKFLRKSSARQFAMAVFVYLVLTRPDVVFYPPMGEGVTGPFSDTIWLVQHNLNYFTLLQQDTFTNGGPQIYPTALYPFFVAVLIKILPSAKIFLFCLHSMYFLMTAIIVTLLRKAAKRMFADDRLGILLPLLFLYLPLSQCMVELLNLEIPSLFFVMLTAFFLIEDKIGLAGIMSLAALFVKDPGVIACAAVFIAALLKFLSGDSLRKNLRCLFWPLLVVIIAFVKSYARAVIVKEQKSFNMISFLCGWQNIWPSVWFYIFLFSLIIILAAFLIENFPSPWWGGLGRGKRIFRLLIDDYRALTIMTLFALLWFLLYLNFLTMAYRYELLLMPFLLFSSTFALSLIMRNRLSPILMVFIFTALVSSYGLMYAKPHGVTADNRKETEPTNLERSLEYRNFIKMEMALAQEIEKNYSAYAIVAPFQTAQILGIPELGYVSKKLDVTVYGMRETLGLKPFTGLKDLPLAKTIFIGYPEQKIPKIQVPYPIDPEDRIVKKIEKGHLDVYLFQGGIAIERMRLLVETVHRGEWLLEKIKAQRGGK